MSLHGQPSFFAKPRAVKVAVGTLNTGRTSLGAGSVGGSKMMIKLATEHATQRRQFKTRIADFEMIRQKITNMTASTYALESMVYLTTGLIDRHVVDYSLEWEGRTHSVGTSIGLVPVGALAVSAAQVLQAADTACYAAKRGGRNQVALHATL